MKLMVHGSNETPWSFKPYLPKFHDDLHVRSSSKWVAGGIKYCKMLRSLIIRLLYVIMFEERFATFKLFELSIIQNGEN